MFYSNKIPDEIFGSEIYISLQNIRVDGAIWLLYVAACIRIATVVFRNKVVLNCGVV